ncbi:MAG: DEAD/DEAH box helicase family protein [Thaumarchaeota archaeon]|nr:DEAD/DEAH box helicase family protein [Nitrososphaerota archaeon]
MELKLVNRIRDRVKKWRTNDYPGVTRTTRMLLEYWKREGREIKLFFCQLEAAETIIWLAEAPVADKQGIEVPQDHPIDAESVSLGFAPLRRLCCKMATGSGKTVVMAMLIAWSVLNKVQNRQDTRFSDAILAVCPNLTIKERLQVLRPGKPGNYYDEFDLVPRSLLPMLTQGRYQVVNWQALAEDKDPAHGVVRRGEETPSAFASRILHDLGSKTNILVINDEAHHAYRPPLRELGIRQEALELKGLTASERKEREEQAEEATVWVNALDKINMARKVNFCLDMSATPYYIKGSGHSEGEPFPWLISDFGLVDAIESGIVKIPRVPIDDNSGRPIPKYFRLWESIMSELPPGEREGTHRKAKPEAVMRHAEGALATLASQWRETFAAFDKRGSMVPPTMIVVCANTDLADEIFKHLTNGKVLPELENKEGQLMTLQIDNKKLEEAENQVEPTETETAPERLRRYVATVGKIGEPGEQIRCVVSVAMLNEGWDAHNVTQILGLRAFTSQLLCEQVVGRGLRRTDYDNLDIPEYVDVYGVPFEVIPVQKGSLKTPLPATPPTLVRALPERKGLEIRFPRVEGYVFDVRYRIRADLESLPKLRLDPAEEPTEVAAKGAVLMKLGKPTRSGPGKEVQQDRHSFHAVHRLQTSVYEIAAELTTKLSAKAPPHIIFPQVKDIVWRFVRERVELAKGAELEDVALLRYRDEIITRLLAAIRPETELGRPPILPVIEKYRSTGSTSEVMFRTVKDYYATTKSPVSHVALDSHWEKTYAYDFENNPHVLTYVKNDHLDFTIPYEYEGARHDYYPDYIVKVANKEGYVVNLILEVKGYESEKDRAKITGAQRWVEAINYHGGFGVWRFAEGTSRNLADAIVEKLYNSELGDEEKAKAERN